MSTKRSGLPAILFSLASAPVLAQEIDTNAQWTVANLGPKINSEYSDRFSVVSNDGLSLYFASNRRISTLRGATISRNRSEKP
jgi:hypothetical protein